MAQRKRKAPTRQQHLPEAVAIGDFAERTLTDKYGQGEWIAQAVDAVKNAVQMSVTQLAGKAPPPTGIPLGAGGTYGMPARTPEEIRASVADMAGSSDPAPKEDHGVPSVERPSGRPVPWVW